MEVDAHHLFRTNGIGYEAHVVLPGIGRVDFLLAGFLLRDRQRNNTSTVTGYAVLRYMPEHIWFHPEQVMTEIRAVLDAGTGAFLPALTLPAMLGGPTFRGTRGKERGCAGHKPGRNVRQRGGRYRLAAGTRTQSTSTGLSVGLTQVCGSRPGKVTVSPASRSYCSLVRIRRMLPLIT